MPISVTARLGQAVAECGAGVDGQRISDLAPDLHPSAASRILAGVAGWCGITAGRQTRVNPAGLYLTAVASVAALALTLDSYTAAIAAGLLFAAFFTLPTAVTAYAGVSDSGRRFLHITVLTGLPHGVFILWRSGLSVVLRKGYGYRIIAPCPA